MLRLAGHRWLARLTSDEEEMDRGRRSKAIGWTVLAAGHLLPPAIACRTHPSRPCPAVTHAAPAAPVAAIQASAGATANVRSMTHDC